MRKVDGWTRDELTDELAAGTGDGEEIWRELLADATTDELADILHASDRLRTEGERMR